MRKLFANKKMFMGAVAVMLGVSLLVASLSYAWFNVSGGSPTNNIITVGTLDIELSIDKAEIYNTDLIMSPIYGPGFDDDFTGTIKNTGTIDAFVKLSLFAETTVSTNDPNVKVFLTYHDSMDSNYQNNGANSWYYDEKTDGTYDYYMYLAPGDEYTFYYLVEVDNANMGSEYMGSTITVKADFDATQNHGEAVEAVFGVDMFGLKQFTNSQKTNPGDPGTFYPYSGGLPLGW